MPFSKRILKKLLAYSTVSQLGLMVLGLGTDFSTFHLLTHAFFKAGLFLSAGAIIHALHHAGHDFDAQDMRLMGGLRKKMPFAFSLLFGLFNGIDGSASVFWFFIERWYFEFYNIRILNLTIRKLLIYSIIYHFSDY
ncbi:MAG: proton-conducting transporter membrane subunit [Arcicella sp.]|nr:proton-conducting transporter membrane subunit [Arcicella sp.]